MKKAWILSKLYINSLYGFSGFINDIKANKKSALKKILLGIVIAFGLSGSVIMFVMINIQLFDLLLPIGQQGIIITNSVLIAAVFTLVFGIIGIVATYFVEKEGDLILSMPLKPWHILTAKYSTNYIYEAGVSIIIMATGFMVYGIKSGQGALFYISAVIISLFIPLIPLTIGYLVIIPLMRAGSILKKKDFVMIFSGVVGIIFAFGIQYLSQSMVKLSSNPQAMVEKLTSPDGLIAIAGRAYYPSIWATYGIVDSGTAKGLVNLGVFVLISVLVVIVLITALSNVYATSIIGSQEVSKSRKNLSQGQLKERLKSKGIFSALLAREIKLMNREPIYLLNGPLVIFLMPAILGFVIYMQRGEMTQAFSALAKLNNSTYYMTLGLAALSVFLGVSVNITSTGVSRDGKAYAILKSMPIAPGDYIKAKLVHGIIFGVIGALLCSIIGLLVLKMSLINCIIALVISILFMLPILIAGLFLELSWPKLIWDNPQKAMKQNLNGVIIILGNMFVLPAAGFIVYMFLKTPVYGYVFLIVVPLIISIIMYIGLMKYGEKRYYEIEI